MNRKILVQIFLFLFFLISITFFYYTYFYSKESKAIIVNSPEDVKSFKSKNNLIKNLEYFSVDAKGNEFLITSEYGEINAEDSSLIIMQNVKANINLVNKETIIIISSFAKYNNKSFDTAFSENVILEYLDNKIRADNIDLLLQKSFAQAYNNVIYTNQTTKLFADKLEIDLVTKNSKIFMKNGKKIKIIGK
tara:strand:+ start:413 stop:988 length:576 start_codon:yes stop_codon:yes gene_type:complete